MSENLSFPERSLQEAMRLIMCIDATPFDATLREHFDLGIRKRIVGKYACRYRQHARAHLDFVEHDGATAGTKEIPICTSGVGRPRKRSKTAFSDHIFAFVCGIPRKGAAGTPLAAMAMAD